MPRQLQRREKIEVAMSSRLRDEIVKLAQRGGVSMSEVVCQLCATGIGRAELANVPRRTPGRRPKVRE